MSGGNFLVSLREVLQSERTLLCKTLLKEDVTILEDDCQLTAEQNQFAEIFQMICDESDFETIELDDDAEKVATVICCYIAKKLLARFKCKACTLFMIGNATTNISILSRGNLTIPSTPLTDFDCSAFALLHYYDDFVISRTT